MWCVRTMFTRMLVVLALGLFAGVIQAAPCDTDADGDIDILDIRAISAERGRAANGPNDPYDGNRDGVVNYWDIRYCYRRCTLPRCAIPAPVTNLPPAANAGPDQFGFVGNTMVLDGSGSSDPESAPLNFSWSFTSKPAGSGATLSAPNTVNTSFVIDLPGSYTVQLVVNDGSLSSAPDTVTIQTENRPPLANAGPDQTAFVGDIVTLNGSASSDPDGEPLDFNWSLISKPAGSAATLSDSTAVMPSFGIDAFGTYVAQLVVNDGALDSAPDTVTIDTENSPPVADAGPDQSGFYGDIITLDGSGSSDVDGNPLSYSWSFTGRPPGSGAVLSDPTAVNPTFTIDVFGTFEVELVVNDGTVNSAADSVVIDTLNTPPVANAGPDQTALKNELVTLDGSGSSDVDGDPLTYSWSFLSQPAGSLALLSDPTAVNPTFTLDEVGTYVVQLIVNDGTVDSAADSVTIDSLNTPPVANAGPDQAGLTGDLITLDGSGSTDVDGDPLDYNWSLITKPPGSVASLSDPSAINPSFTIDLYGLYVAQLIVNDGFVDSAPDNVTINTDNTPPVADAGPDQSGFVGDTIVLDGSGSSDVDGQPLSYNWSLITVPTGSAAILSDPNVVNPSFDIDLYGTYVAQLIVNDGLVDSAPDNVTISTDNTVPVADPGPDQIVYLGDTVFLDGSASYDADGHALSFNWSILSAPPGSGAALDDPTLELPQLTPDLAGSYVLQLIVNDGIVDSAPQTMTVTVNPLPTVSIGDASVVEGDSGTADLVFTVTVSPLIDRVVSVDYATRDGSATDPADYTGASATLDIPANTATGTVTVPVIGDEEVEGDHNLFVDLSAPVNASLGDAEGEGTILDDDLLPDLGLSPPSQTLLTLSDGSLTVGIGNPAPPGGRQVNLISDDATVASVPASVTVPEGASSTLVTVSAGSAAGSALITASAAGYNSTTATVNVDNRSMTLSLDSPLVGAARVVNGTIDLAQPAPGGGINVNLISLAPGIATASPASVFIPGGISSAGFQVTGVATGTTSIQGSAAGYGTASVGIEVTSAVINLAGVTLAPGQTLSTALSISEPAPTGGLTIGLVSSDPGIASVTPSVFIPEGTQTPAANPQVTGIFPGTVQIIASAPGFAPDTSTVNVTLTLSFVPPSLDVRDTFTENITLTLSSAAPAGGLTVNLVMDDPDIATAPATAFVPAGQLTVQVPVTGVAVGNTTLHATFPGTTAGSAAINVIPLPPIVNVIDMDVGEDLQESRNLFFSALPSGATDVTVTVADPSVAVVSTSATTVGSGSITIPSVTGTSIGSIWVQGLSKGAGTQQSTTVTVSALGFADETFTVTVVPSGFLIQTPSVIDTTVFAANTTLQLRPYRLNPATLAAVENQSLRAGANVDVTMNSSDPVVGVITPNPVVFTPGDYWKNTGFDPDGIGSTVLSILTPANFEEPNSHQQITANVSGTPINNVQDVTVGEDLQEPRNLYLSASPPAPVAVTVTVADPSVAVISTSHDIVGTGSLVFPGVGGTSIGAIWVQGLTQGGSTDVTVTAPGYLSETFSVTVVPSGFLIQSPGVINTTAFAANTSVQLRPYRLHPDTLVAQQNQILRAGVSVDVAMNSSVPAVGVITPNPVTFTHNDYWKNTAFDPLDIGSTVLSVLTPTGFEEPSSHQQITANVSGTPIVNVQDVTVGEDLQEPRNLYLGAAPPAPVAVTVTVADPSVAVISTSNDIVGGGSLVFPGVGGTSIGAIWVQGLSKGAGTQQSTTVTVTAPGYLSETFTVTVVPSGFLIQSPGVINTTVFSANTSLQLRPYRLHPDTLAAVQNQILRASVSVDITMNSSDPTVGVITPNPVSFTHNDYWKNTGFDPLAIGSTVLSVVTPAGFEEPSVNQQITATVDAPDITLADSIVGNNLQRSVAIALEVAPPNPIDITVTVASGAIATVSTDPLVEGSTSHTFSGVTTTYHPIYVQGRGQGATQITVQAPGYNDRVATVTVDPAGFLVQSPTSINTTVGALDTTVQIRPYRLNPSTLAAVENQTVRGGLSVDVAVETSDPAVGTVTTSPLGFTASDYWKNTAFHPVGTGSTVVGVVTPAGFSPTTTRPQIPVTVSP